jgi:Uma2 family endonuclease
MVARPTSSPVELRPDWVCEVLSPSNRLYDLREKLDLYHSCEVPHYWTVDPQTKILTVYRWSPAGYVVALTASPPGRIRAEPFEVLEWNVGTLFGEDIDATLVQPSPSPEANK